MRIAVYTAVYPSVLGFLRGWYQSVAAQTDKDFSLCIALDGLTPAEVCEAMGDEPEARWLSGAPGASVAQIRQRSLDLLVEECDGVILVDSDDLLLPTRVAAAREALQKADLAACALRLVDETGDDLGWTMTVPDGMTADAVLPRRNLFGLSNSTYRSDLLRRCLPIPAEAVLVDWFLATRAWLIGANIAFDAIPRMLYRQHGANTAQARPPFSVARVAQDTALVRQHLSLALASLPPVSSRRKVAALEETAQDVDAFQEWFAADAERLTRYVEALNRLNVEPLWWACVAHPTLQHMWTD
jgi:hypothetical protein